ncbi:CpsD/CapB family tyrosine-protein kinase [Halobacillus halophilus]|uniref:CpsD/CapB family tyrosine-protein kinase n=1 Tax=Halobacillus halophilus TaxID=1570 RepID=UPI001CD4A26D|nr:CpsD/CapB family tyrosine-protein kinase [Halobacillus halophilus]MCA1010099.1 CpsD/CapB family tyrosine-protein kinase [Halobacillus halophilus]
MILSKIRQAKKRRNLITYTNPDSVVSDQFRTIRTNMKFLTDNRNSHNFLLTSPNNQEGTSTTGANLAVSMAFLRDKILLIDANLRSPYQHVIFKTDNEIGLNNIIAGQTTFKQAVYKTGIGNLDLLTSGSSMMNPTEVISDEKMVELLKEVSSTYDIVLVDSPSVLQSTETRVLAHHCDGVVLIINKGKTDLQKAAEAKSILDLAHADIVGAILNDRK